MREKPLEATLKRYNKKVYITLLHRPCHTVVDRGVFPEGCPVRAMTGWIQRKNELFPLGHKCHQYHSNGLLLADAGILPVHTSSNTSLF